MANFYASYPVTGGGGSVVTGDLTDTGTDGIVITGGTGAVVGTGTSIAQTKADATHNGYLASADFVTFSNKQPAITTGNLTDAGTDGIIVTGGTGAVIGAGTSIAQTKSDATHNGYLASADFSTFSTTSGAAITSLTGNVTATGPGAATATIAANSITTAMIQNAAVTTNQIGLAAVNAARIASAAVTAAKMAAASVDLTTSTVTGALPIGNGGTGQITKTPAFDALQPMTTAGDLILGGASGTGTRLAIGGNNTILTSNGTTASWAAAGTPTLNQFNMSVGNSSNVATSVQTNLLGNVKASTTTSTVTITNASPGVISWTSNGLAAGSTVYFTTSGTLPTGISPSTTYYVRTAGTNSFTISATIGGAEINTSSAGSGTHTGFAGGLVFNPAVQLDYIILDTGNGAGSSNTSVRRFTNQTGGPAAALTYADSATLGGSVTINIASLYHVAYYDRAGAIGQDFGVTVNSTAAPNALGPAACLGIFDSTAIGGWGCVSTMAYLNVNDVLRCTYSGGTLNTNSDTVWRVTKIL